MTTATEIKEHPILFSGAMVRAILGGTKTQTRRVVKPQPYYEVGRGVKQTRPSTQEGMAALQSEARRVSSSTGGYCGGGNWMWAGCCYGNSPGLHNGLVPPIRRSCSYGQPGDRLRVKEPFRVISFGGGTAEIVYESDGSRSIVSSVGMPDTCRRVSEHKCPVSARRLLLEVVSVRVERVQEISLAECAAEGAPPTHEEGWDCTDTFRDLWDSTNAKQGHGWDANPWVWVIEFKKIEQP